MVTSIFLKKTWPSFCSSYIQILYFRGAQIDSGQCSFYICALTLKSFNVVLLDCNEPLLSAMRCSWKTLFSRLCVFSFDIVRSLLLVSIELQRDREEKISIWYLTNGPQKMTINCSIEFKWNRESQCFSSRAHFDFTPFQRPAMQAVRGRELRRKQLPHCTITELALRFLLFLYSLTLVTEEFIFSPTWLC